MEPVFSPDGRWIAYFSPAGGPGSSSGTWILKKIAISGGAPITLAQLPGPPFGASWRNGTIAFGVNTDASLVQAVSDSGGPLRTLATADAAKETVAQPQLLEDGKHVLFALRARGRAASDGTIMVQALDGKDRRTLVNGGSDPRVLPTGQLLYIHDGTLLAVPFGCYRRPRPGGGRRLGNGGLHGGAIRRLVRWHARLQARIGWVDERPSHSRLGRSERA